MNNSSIQSKKKNSKLSLTTILGTLSSILFIVLLWQIVSISKNNTYVYPGIITIFKQTLNIFTNISYLSILLKTIINVVIVIIISLLMSFILSFIYLIVPKSIAFYKPLINILKATPFAIISVYVFIAFKREYSPYITTFMVIFPITFEGIINSFDNIDSGLIDELRLLNLSLINKFIYVYIPIVLPYIVITILQSFGLGIKVMIMAEYVSQVEGTIGMVLVNTKYAMEFDIILAWLVVIVIIVSIIDFVVRLLFNKVKKLSN